MAENEKPGFFQELKKRKIYRVAVVYAITGWLLIQIADATFQFLNIPDWVARVLILIIAIGFPIALILAWAFEMSPQGMVRTTSEEARSNPLPPNKKKPLTGTVTIVVLITLLAGQFVYYSFIRNPDNEVLAEEVREERVAVAPFNNYTGDANLDALGYMASDWITSGLRQLEVKTSSPEVLRKYKDHVGVLPGNSNDEASLYRLTNAEYVVTGSLYLQGNDLQVSSRLESTISGEVIHEFPSIHGSLNRKEELITELSNKLKGFWAIKNDDNLTTINAPSYEAYQIYLDCDFVTSQCYLDALEADPTFIQAWNGLYYASYLAGLDSLALTARDYISDHWDQLTEFEKNSFHLAEYTGQKRYQEVLEALEANYKLDPLDPKIIHESAYYYLALNQPGKAVERLETIFHDYETFKEVMLTDSPLVYMIALNRMGDYTKVLEFANSHKNDLIVVDTIMEEINRALLIQGEFDQLEDWIEFYQANDVAISYLDLAYQYNEIYPDAISNRFEDKARLEASELSRLGTIEIPGVLQLKNYSSKAFAFYILKEYDQAEKLLTGYTEQDYKEFTDSYTSREQVPYYAPLWIDGLLGAIYARQGKSGQALDQIEQLGSFNLQPYAISRPMQGLIPYLQARIYAILGDKESAVACVKKSIQEGRLCEWGHFTNDWDLSSLYDYEPFLELMKFE
jgi:TolB-like protein